MALLPILTHPNERLHIVAQPVVQVDDRIRTLVQDMAETMYAARGIGLAATQVDVHERVVVIDLSEEHNQLLALINPVITKKDGETTYEEGCLSVPGFMTRLHVPTRLRWNFWTRRATSSRWTQMVCWRFVFSTSLTIWQANCLWNICRRLNKIVLRRS